MKAALDAPLFFVNDDQGRQVGRGNQSSGLISVHAFTSY